MRKKAALGVDELPAAHPQPGQDGAGRSRPVLVEELVEAIYRVHRGRRYVSPLLAERLVAADAGESGGERELSERELEVLRHLAAGRSPKEIGARLGVSPKTVSTYRARIVAKLGLESTAELVRFAMDQGLLDDPPASA